MNYLEFEYLKDTKSGKTQIYNVRPKNDEDCSGIGIIKWNPGWRRYSYYPNPCTYLGRSCLRDIADFIDKLMSNK